MKELIEVFYEGFRVFRGYDFREAETALIEDDALEAAAKFRDLLPPAKVVACYAVKKDYCRP